MTGQQADRQTLFYRTLLATAADPIIKSLQSLTSKTISRHKIFLFHKIQSTRRFLHLCYDECLHINVQQELCLFKWLVNNNYTNFGKRKGFLEQIKQHESAWELLLCMKKKKKSYRSIFHNQKHK